MSGERAEDRRWMVEAIELSMRCPPVASAFAVGAVIVGADGRRLADGYSRESDPVAHAEESALAKLAGADPEVLAGATLYTSLEPCSRRSSRPRGCAQLVLDSGIRRVVLAWREPPLFVEDARGAELLRGRGVEVVELSELAEAARAVNAWLLR